MSLTAGLLLMAAAQSSPWFDPAPTGRWAASTAKLASELLPSEMARDVVSHRVTRSIVQGGQPFSVEFEGRARATGDGFCERFEYYVHIGGLAERTDAGDPPIRSTKIRLGDCPSDLNLIFANLNASDPDGAKRALQWVAWAKNVARSRSPLPFELSCKTETGPDRCTDGGRSALARLPLEKTYIVMPIQGAPAHRWRLAVTKTIPGDHLWDVRIDATPGKASIDLVWLIPPPF